MSVQTDDKSPYGGGGSMSEREYRAWCVAGQHGSYVRLRTAEPQRFARCPICGADVLLTVLPRKAVMSDDLVSDDLVTWLRAQLDEDERVARLTDGQSWIADGVTVVEIDPNVRTVGNGTYAGLEDVHGALAVGHEVVLRESEAGIEGRGTVTKIDRVKRLVYFDVDWSTFRAVAAATQPSVAWYPAANQPSHAEHIARHDPARVLAEVEAKRALIEETIRPWLGNDQTTGRIAWVALRLLAWPYADRPGYQEAWRP